MDAQLSQLEASVGSAGDLWKVWKLDVEGMEYIIQETRIGHQVLKKGPHGFQPASAEEKQRLMLIFKRLLDEAN